MGADCGITWHIRQNQCSIFLCGLSTFNYLQITSGIIPYSSKASQEYAFKSESLVHGIQTADIIGSRQKIVLMGLHRDPQIARPILLHVHSPPIRLSDIVRTPGLPLQKALQHLEGRNCCKAPTEIISSCKAMPLYQVNTGTQETEPGMTRSTQNSIPVSGTETSANLVTLGSGH